VSFHVVFAAALLVHVVVNATVCSSYEVNGLIIVVG